MNDLQPNITTILNQMILANVNGCINEIEENLKKKIIFENKPFLTIDDVVELTGLKKSSLYNYMNQGLLSFYKINNKKVFFKMDDISNFIFNKKNYYNSKTEMRQEALNEYLQLDKLV